MSTENKRDSSESFIENSDVDSETQLITKSSNRPNIIVNSSNDSVCSVENDMEIINTSTRSLSRSHAFFNKPKESSTSTT